MGSALCETRYCAGFKRKKPKRFRRSDPVSKAPKGMTYDGKPVYTPDDFSYSEARIGGLVTQEVVDGAMDCLPPACMTSACAQMGEPHGICLDPETGTYRNTYPTFRRVTGGRDGIWEYRGNCFRGETVERGTEPPYVSPGT